MDLSFSEQFLRVVFSTFCWQNRIKNIVVSALKSCGKKLLKVLFFNLKKNYEGVKIGDFLKFYEFDTFTSFHILNFPKVIEFETFSPPIFQTFRYPYPIGCSRIVELLLIFKIRDLVYVPIGKIGIRFKKRCNKTIMPFFSGFEFFPRRFFYI